MTVEELELEILRLRDEVIGLRAEHGERAFRVGLLRDSVERLNKDLSEQTDLLRENMTRAFNAERELLHLREFHDATVASLRNEIVSLRSSRSYRLGRAISSPARLIRRAFRAG